MHMATNLLFSLPIELREIIYRYAIDHKINLTFQSKYQSFGVWDLQRDPEPEPGRLYETDAYLDHLVKTTGRPFEYGPNLCSVTYNISPLPRHLLLVSKNVFREVLETDRITRLTLVQKIQRILVAPNPNEPWQLQLSREVTPEMRHIMRISRIIFDCSDFEFTRQLHGLSPTVRQLFRSILLAGSCKHAMKPIFDGYIWPNLETLALVVSEDPPETTSALYGIKLEAVKLLHERKIKRLEYIKRDPEAGMEEWEMVYLDKKKDYRVRRLSKKSIYHRGRFKSVGFKQTVEHGGLIRCKEIRVPIECSVTTMELAERNLPSASSHIQSIAIYEKE